MWSQPKSHVNAPPSFEPSPSIHVSLQAYRSKRDASNSIFGQKSKLGLKGRQGSDLGNPFHPNSLPVTATLQHGLIGKFLPSFVGCKEKSTVQK
jgi:hypothetical protein